MNSSTVSFSLLSWNVRGLGDKNKCTIVHDTLTSARSNNVCLQETKLRAIDSLRARSFLPVNLDAFRCVDSNETRGGMVTAWDSTAFTLASCIIRQHTLTTFLSSTASDYTFAVTNVYAPADHRDSLPFLENLEEIAGHVPGSWALAGDFNLTRGGEENRALPMPLSV